MKQRYCQCGNTIPINPYSTIQAKKCPSCTHKEAVSKKNNRKTKAKTTRKSSKSKAMSNADKWFSRYIRLKYHYKIETDGTVIDRCIITGQLMQAKNCDNGHCFSRENKSTRFEEDNCRPQNRKSNRYQGEADHYTFRENLRKEIGDERFERIEKLMRESGNDSEVFYNEQAEKYRKLTNDLLKKFSAKKWW